MHISEGVLNTPTVVVTTIAAVGLIVYSAKGVKSEEIPKIALMTGVFFTGSLIHIPIGPASIHLLLSGIIGMILGRRTPISISLALILQLFLFQFGGLTSFGANVLNTSLPAMLMFWLVRPLISEKKSSQFICGVLAGSIAVVGTVLGVGISLVESNTQFGIGAFSTIHMLVYGHIPLMIIEGIFTGFVVQFIVSVRPQILAVLQNDKEEVKPLTINNNI